MTTNDILAYREERQKNIILKAQNGDVICVKANIPGADKCLGVAFIIVRYFTGQILKIAGGNAEFYHGKDGPYSIIFNTKNFTKENCCTLEDQPIGRFVDVDFYPKGANNSLSRGYMRKCYLCDKPAFVCQREKTHTTGQLLSYIDTQVTTFINISLSNFLKEALLYELNLEFKFGLVTPTSKGSHKDMDYNLMVKSQNIIIPWLCQMFWIGFKSENINQLLPKLREAGKACEVEMFNNSGGVNTYKGFIFTAGIILGALGFTFNGKNDFKFDIFEVVKIMCKDITGELSTQPQETDGIKIYKTYGIMGVRKNAQDGFPSIPMAVKLIDDNYSPESLRRALCYIVANIDDTVLIKRCKSLEKYKHFKDKISNAYTLSQDQLINLNNQCINENLSIGGSADILATSILVKKLADFWCIKIN